MCSSDLCNYDRKHNIIYFHMQLFLLHLYQLKRLCTVYSLEISVRYEINLWCFLYHTNDCTLFVCLSYYQMILKLSHFVAMDCIIMNYFIFCHIMPFHVHLLFHFYLYDFRLYLTKMMSGWLSIYQSKNPTINFSDCYFLFAHHSFSPFLYFFFFCPSLHISCSYLT